MSTSGLSKLAPTSIALTRTISDATTGTQNNYNPTGFSEAAVVQFTASGGISLTGLLATINGDIKVILNAGTGTVTLFNQNASSSAANRFNFAESVTISPNECAIIQYDGTNSCWRLMSHAYANDIQAFTSNGTWTKPVWATEVNIYLIGGGGGGGGGRWSAAGTLARGGWGGGSAGVSELSVRASAILTTTVSVTIGSAGAAGAHVTTISTDGGVGGKGGSTTFGAYLSAVGGSGGLGGTAVATGTAPSLAGGTYSNGTVGGASSTTGLVGPNPVTAAPYLASGFSPGSGAPGGGVTTANATSAGGVGESNCYLGFATTGGSAGAAGTNGSTGNSNASKDQPGSGGGGGGSNTGVSAKAGDGGAGGLYGGGGGGGGGVSGASGNTSGAGGAGAAGFALIISSR